MYRFYAIEVKTGRESWVKEQYEKIYGSHKQVDVSLFVVSSISHTNSIQQMSRKPNSILPGYIFIKCPELNSQLYYRLKDLKNVIRVFQNDTPEEEIIKFMSNLKSRYEQMLDKVKRLADLKTKIAESFNMLFAGERVVKVNYHKTGQIIIIPKSYPLLN